jgi:hypothetical protein
MAYEELSEPWYPPRVGDWVTDSNGDVWKVGNQIKNGRILCTRTTATGRTGRSWKLMSHLTKLDDSLGKILTSVNKEN